MRVEARGIVVIGAGPAGSMAAREAALRGLSPLLVERGESPGAGNACGGLVASALCAALELGPDVVECRIQRTILRIDSRCVEFNSERPYFISFRRANFDAFLAERAVQAGAELLVSTRVTGVDAAKRRVRLRDLVSGREHEVAARTIIFADGPRTLAASACGIGHRPGPATTCGLVLELEGPYGDGRSIEILVDTGAGATGYFWVFPKRDCVQVGVGAPVHSSARPLPARLKSFLETRPDLRERKVLSRRAALLPGGVARRLVADGAMVVGDAAGLVNPLTGGGLIFAVLSGQMAGQVAADAVISGQTEADSLRRYRRYLQRTPQYLWLKVMACCRRSVGFLDPHRPARAYATMLERYLGFIHLMRLPIRLLLR